VIKSLFFGIVYYLSVANWKVDTLSKRTLGVFYFLLFLVIPQLLSGYLGLWVMLIWCIVIPRILYLLGILDYFSKKLEKA
jgi:hypothetical protein